MKKIVASVILVCLFSSAFAQLNFYFVPELYGKSVDGLGVFQVQNLTGENKQGKIIISVQENSTHASVVTITTPEISFLPGINQFPKSVFVSSLFNFFPNAYSSLANQTRSIPPGEYTYCFRFIAGKSGQEDYENCFDGNVQPMVPMQLTLPENLDTICNKRPMLSWQPPMPYQNSMRFRLLLTEKKKRNAEESVLMDIPLLLLDNISTTSINYPANYPELKEGKTYCWQVITYQQNIIVSKSEAWEFTVQCHEAVPVSPDESYRELKSLAGSNYYIANRYLKFTFRNDYAIKKLKYEILNPAKTPARIKNTPEVVIEPGLNKVDLDVSDLGLEAGKNYILKVYPFNEPPVEVRFVYMEK